MTEPLKPHNFYVRMLTPEEAEDMLDEIDRLPPPGPGYARQTFTPDPNARVTWEPKAKP